SAFLLVLVKVNLAMGAAIVLVALLRRPFRARFGAPVAYSIWFLVPIAAIASLLPPRVAPLVPAHVVLAPAALISVTSQFTDSALRVTEQTGQRALVLTVLPSASPPAMPDITLLLFVAWVLGASLMALYLTQLQLRFHAAMRLREAGPAVLGFLRPRIVTPE